MNKNIIGLAFCILMVLIGGFMIVRQISIGKDTVDVMATVDRNVNVTGKPANNSYYIKYSVDGKEYTTTYYSDKKLGYGDRIRVSVSKSDPKVVKQGEILLPILCVILGLLYGYMCIVKLRNGQEK